MAKRSGKFEKPKAIAAVVFALTMIAGFGIGLLAGEDKPVAKRSQSTHLAKYEKPKPTIAATEITPEPEPKEEPKPKPKTKPTKPTEPKPEPTKPKPEPTKPTPPPATKPEPKPEPPVQMVSYTDKILPIFKAKCNLCHGDPKIEGDLDLRTLMAIAKSPNKLVLVAGNPDDSEIYTRIKDRSMPPGNKEKLTDAEMKLVLDWIKSGAK